MQVSEIMNHDFTCCFEGDDISEAAAAMKVMVRRLFVLDREGNVVGVLSLDDISDVGPLASGEVLQAITA